MQETQPKWPRCPDCNSANITIERRPNGYTICRKCKRKRKHDDFCTPDNSSNTNESNKSNVSSKK